MKIRILLFLLTSSLLFSCVDPYHHRKSTATPVSLDYKIVNRSEQFKKQDMKIALDTADHELIVTLSSEGFKHFPFPIHTKYHDTLVNTAFRFDFYYNGKLLQTDYMSLKRSAWEPDSSANANVLSIYSDTMNMSVANEFLFHIPMYAFHDLKKGKQTLEMEVAQQTFTGQAEVKTKDGSTDFIDVREEKPLLNARIKFDINVPPVYKSLVYGYGLQLRNDSTFSPAGMDNTIWNSSYPDIYWMLYYPVNDYYTKTLYEKSTDHYEARDTFNLYHYYANDSIGIGVYDHDYLSADDGLGYWTGNLSQLEKYKINRIHFGYVKSFDIKVEPMGIVN